MDEDERMANLWRTLKDRFGHKFDLEEFTAFCHEWDAVCEKIRKYAGRE